MAKSYGDVVVYTQNGSPQNALVVHSATVGDEEQLTLLFLDPTLQGSTIGSAGASKAFSVKPLTDGARFGWSEYAASVQARLEAGEDAVATLNADNAELAQKLEEAGRKLTEAESTFKQLNDENTALKAAAVAEPEPPAPTE